MEKELFGKKSFCFDNFDLFPLKHDPEIGCPCENCVDLTEYRKDPSLEKFSSQQFCLDKCKCRLCVRKREERATGWHKFLPYHTDFACLCLECRRQRLEWQQAEIKTQRQNILRYRRQIRDPGSYVGFYLGEEDDRRQKRLAKLVKESEVALKATEETLWQKYGIVVTKVDELQIEQEQEEDKQAEYRRNFPHTCLRCIIEDNDKFIRSKSEKEQVVFGARSPGNKTGMWKIPGPDTGFGAGNSQKKIGDPLKKEEKDCFQEQSHQKSHKQESYFDRQEVEKQTREQHKSDRWHQERKYKLTLSRFGEICKRCKYDLKYCESLST